MKIVTYVLIALLVVTLGAAAFFYFNVFTPMAADYTRMKGGLPELEKAKIELKQYRDRENKETVWMSPAVDILSMGLSEEIKAGKAEVLTAGNRIIVNIAEDALYLPGSYTFGKDSPRLRLILISLLRKNELKGKEIYIGNTAEDVPAHGRGRKKIPAKDARTLAFDRSASLIKDLEKNGVSQDALIGAAYSSKQPEVGFKLKSRKTVIIIENPPMVPMVARQSQSVQQPQPRAIPIQPARPKAQ
ncbi:MAG TPA: hypothetical protein VL122_09525 [Nitrospirota bacterium]|nr:hypothetical protein [Nitrospirota bacterium]